jgi:membrane associated rhomboid family serine protease
VTYIPAALLIGFWFVMQVLNFGSVAEVRTGGVAYLAHIAGFLFGAILARTLVDKRRLMYRGGYY